MGAQTGFRLPRICLPRPDIDLSKWAVVACDQYTSEPEYWRRVDELVGDAPSTLRLIYPEVHLGASDREARIGAIRSSMSRYTAEGILVPHDGMVYVERQCGERTRRGLVVCLDLEAYDYSRGSASLIRATEGTILERIPPRVAIRKGAPLELPHIMVLVDDPDDTVIGAVAAGKDRLRRLYDFDLMLGAGHLTGHLVDDLGLEREVASALESLAAPEAFAARYGVDRGHPVLLYAVGDGNHSLATAKAIWQETKGGGHAGATSLAGHALVELVNLHDPALEFEPIHRVLFGVKKDLLGELRAHFGPRVSTVHVDSFGAMKARVDEGAPDRHLFGIVRPGGVAVLVEVTRPEANLPVGTLQAFLDRFMADRKAAEIDYVHGSDTVASLGAKDGNLGFYLPAMRKQDLFKTVIVDGALPRKTFSMGAAHEKRFYMECRSLA